MSEETKDEGVIEIVAPPEVLTGQTVKQPVVWRCPNRECVEPATLFDPTDLAALNRPGVRYFEFAADYPECPKCGSGPPAVTKRALIHLLVRDKKGPILGDMGLRWSMACDPKRTHLATEDNGEAATGNSLAINCPGCIAALAKSGRVYLQGVALKISV